MSRQLEFRLDANAIRPLVEHVRGLLSELSSDLAAPNEAPVEDDIMTDFWSRDLLESQKKDVGAIAELFDDEFMKSGRATIDEEDVDRVLRGCTAVRLKIRETALAALDDEALERGEINDGELSDEEENGYGAYVLFASLQELIISQMNP